LAEHGGGHLDAARLARLSPEGRLLAMLAIEQGMAPMDAIRTCGEIAERLS
jgi:hypothetical protein